MVGWVFFTLQHPRFSDYIVTSSSLTLTLLSPSFTFKDPGDYTRPTWIIQDSLPIPRSINGANSYENQMIPEESTRDHTLWSTGRTQFTERTQSTERMPNNLFCLFPSLGKFFLMMPRLITRVTMQNTKSGNPGIMSLSREAAAPLIRPWSLVLAQLIWLVSLGLC